mgnify:CR=1 FL=1
MLMKIEIEASFEALEEVLDILENEVRYKQDYSDGLAGYMDDVINQINTQLSEEYRDF